MDQVLTPDFTGKERTIDTGAAELIDKAHRMGIETGFDRLARMLPQCGFGLLGVCCRRCYNGPCRVSLFEEGPQRGVCGAGADTIVARNFLETLTAGAAPHAEHAREVALTLLEAAEGRAPYPIRSPEKLRQLAAGLGIEAEGVADRELAAAVARRALADFQQQDGVIGWLGVHAPAEARERWDKLGVLPTNAHLEIARSATRTAMGCDADPVNLLLGAVTMGLVDGYDGCHLSSDLQDVLFGMPQLVRTRARLGVLEAEQVNIAVHGHVPVLSEKVLEAAGRLEEEARQAGAQGINVVGVCCTGNELMERHGVPLASNFAGQELVLMTGACDAMVVDVQCIMPGLAEVAKCFHTAFITTLPYVKIPGATHVEFSPARADQAAEEIVRRAIDAYRRRNPALVTIPDDTVEMWGGFTPENILGALGKVNAADPLGPLVDAVAAGDILGAVAIVGCTGFKVRHDWANTELARHLLHHNVLVLANGCGGHSLARHGFTVPGGKALEYCGASLRGVLEAVGQANGLPSLPPVLHVGSCVDNARVADLLVALAARLGVAVRDLPVAGSSPEVQSPKVLSIGAYFLSLGVDVHVGLSLQTEGSPFVHRFLTEPAGGEEPTLDALLGSTLIVESDPARAAEKILARLRHKRQALGLKEAAVASA